jgi:hypothetical protein
MSNGVMPICENYLATQNGLESFGLVPWLLPFKLSNPIGFTVYNKQGTAFTVICGEDGAWFKNESLGGWIQITNSDGSNFAGTQGTSYSSSDNGVYVFSKTSGNMFFEASNSPNAIVTVRPVGVIPIDPGRMWDGWHGAAADSTEYFYAAYGIELGKTDANGNLVLASGVRRHGTYKGLMLKFDPNAKNTYIGIGWDGTIDTETGFFVPETTNANTVRFYVSAACYRYHIDTKETEEDIGTPDQLYLVGEIPVSDLDGNDHTYPWGSLTCAEFEEPTSSFDVTFNFEYPETDNLGDAVGIEQINLSTIPASNTGSLINGRIFVLDESNPIYLAYSAQQGTAYREQFNALQRLEIPGNGVITSFGKLSDDLIVFTENESYIVYSADPANGAQFFTKIGSMGRAYFEPGRGVFFRSDDGQFRIINESTKSVIESYSDIEFSRQMGTILAQNDSSTSYYGHPNLEMCFAENCLFIIRRTARGKEVCYILNYDEGLGWTQVITDFLLNRIFLMGNQAAFLATQSGTGDQYLLTIDGNASTKTRFSASLSNDNGYIELSDADVFAEISDSGDSPSLAISVLSEGKAWSQDPKNESVNPVSDASPRFYRFIPKRSAWNARPCGRYLVLIFESQEEQKNQIHELITRGFGFNPIYHPEWTPWPQEAT